MPVELLTQLKIIVLFIDTIRLAIFMLLKYLEHHV